MGVCIRLINEVNLWSCHTYGTQYWPSSFSLYALYLILKPNHGKNSTFAWHPKIFNILHFVMAHKVATPSGSLCLFTNPGSQVLRQSAPVTDEMVWFYEAFYRLKCRFTHLKLKRRLGIPWASGTVEVQNRHEFKMLRFFAVAMWCLKL